VVVRKVVNCNLNTIFQNESSNKQCQIKRKVTTKHFLKPSNSGCVPYTWANKIQGASLNRSNWQQRFFLDWLEWGGCYSCHSAAYFKAF
jgi:hypothetical protein